MKRTILSLWILSSAAFAEIAPPEVEHTPTGCKMSWVGGSHTMFLQYSFDLQSWSFFPEIETGAGNYEYNFSCSSDKMFVRVKYTDTVVPDPSNHDFDGDGLTSINELTVSMTDPLEADTDGDTLLDGWETANGLDPNDDGTTNITNGASGDPDNDGLTNAEEQQNNTDPNDADSDDDGVTDGGEVDQGNDPNDPNDTPDAEWFILTGDLEEDVEKARNRRITIPAGESRVVVVVVASDEYPDWTGDASEFNDTLSWDIRPAGLAPLTGSIDVNNRHDEWETAELEGREAQGFSPAHVETGMTLTAPDDAPLVIEIDLKAKNIGDGTLPSTVLVGVLPVVPVEFFPELLDGDGAAIANSQVPRTGSGQTNGMTEENPVANRIAHREVKMRIVDGKILEGKKLTWSMAPLFVPPAGGNPVFRGDWANSTTHPNRYETAVQYGANGFEAVNQATARTEIDENGETAIRTNLAPVGFNKGRLRIEVEGFVGNPAKVADMEVPPVIVIDPGHGGTANLPGSSWNNATSPTGIREKNMALSYGTELRTSLLAWATANDAPFSRMIMTRTADMNVSGANRAARARDNGADVIFIIHFNAFNGVARGTLEVRRTNGNVNAQEDIDFIDRVLDDLVPAIQGFDAAANRRAAVAVNTSVASDANLGNVAAYHPVRAGYCEVEFIDNPQVDQLLNHGANAAAVRAAVANATADAIIEDIMRQPNP